MTTQHTPGPWTYSLQAGKDTKHFICANQGKKRLALLDPEDRLMTDEIAADARLIAAAPDLLDALAEIANLLATHPDVEIGNSKIHYAMHKARNAIAIATSL